MKTVSSITLYSTCPQSKDAQQGEYAALVREIARWSEAAGCHGMLVYTDNGIADPWLVAQHAIEGTTSLRPLVAVQPAYMHPYTAAKMIATLAYLHGRTVDLNLLAGGFSNDLAALGEQAEHDDRYARTVEYGTIVRRLVEGTEPVTFEGRFYQVESLRLTPPVEPSLHPQLLVSGSSPAGVDAARALGAVAVKYPLPPGEEYPTADVDVLRGIRVGIIAREEASEAWAVARERFPEDRRGQLAHSLAMKVSDSHWHRSLSQKDEPEDEESQVYWLRPFKNYSTFCPYFVGSYDDVAAEIAQYINLGFRTFITDIPREPDDLDHACIVLGRAAAASRA